MKTTSIWTGIAVTVLIIAMAGCSGDSKFEDTVAGDIGQNLDAYLSGIVPFGFSGAAIVAKDDEILLNKGYGMAIVADSIPNSSQTIFSTGSITKQFTAAAIMKLQMQGKLNTDNLITEYFDDVPEDKQSIRLHHLLTHTAGLPGSLGSDFEVVGRYEMMTRVLRAPLDFPPGEEFGYSNCGYSMLAAVIELVSGMTYEEFLNTHLFAPAGMNHTGYRLPDWSKRTVAHWYAGSVDNGIPLDKDYPYWNYIGNGGILSTTDDMLKWHLALTGNEILSPQAKEKLYTPFLNDYAYGWDVLDTDMGTLIQHDGGSTLGCAADFKRFVDSNLVIMLFSNRSGSETLMDKGVRDKVVRIAFGGKVEMPQSLSATSADLSVYQGNYLLDNSAAYLVTASKNALQITPFGGRAITGLYVTSDSLLKVVAGNEARSIEVMSAAIKDDFEPFRALINDDARLQRIKQLWYMRANRYSEMTGPLTDAVASFSWPSGYEPGATETIMEIQGQQSSIYYRMIWKDDKMIGIAPTQPPGIGPQTFLPAAPNQFFTYDITAAKNILVSFTADSMVIIGDDGTLGAVRGQ